MAEFFEGKHYRFEAARGLEVRRTFERTFHPVTGEEMRSMTWQELEHVAHVMKLALGRALSEGDRHG